MIGMIACVSSNGVIGIDNKLPFNYPEDMKYFKKLTTNNCVIMGRKTYESIGKPLPNRTNVIVTSSQINDLVCVNSIEKAINYCDEINIKNNTSIKIDREQEPCKPNIWLIGGASIYEEGMEYARKIYLTITSDHIVGNNVIRFPWINPLKFNKDSQIYNSKNNLMFITYVKDTLYSL